MSIEISRPRNSQPEPAKGAKLTRLLRWHFYGGTRPLGHQRSGKAWTPSQLKRAARQSYENIRNWIPVHENQKGTTPSSDKFAVLLEAFFGAKSEKYTEWDRVQIERLRSAHEEAWRDVRAKAGRPKRSSADRNRADMAPSVVSNAPVSSIPRPSGSQPILRGVPPRNPDFTGRAAELEKVASILATATGASVSPVAVHALGGMGKTSFATEYAHEHGHLYAGIWWAPAENKTLLIASLAQLATIVAFDFASNPDVEFVAKETLARLGSIDPPWLLIYDNVPSPAEIADVLPGGRTRLLVTTRWADWTGYAAEIELRPWDESSAIEFLLKRAELLTAADARLLAGDLGFLPLAIDHAGAYLRHTGVTAREYLSRLHELMSKVPAGALYPRSVYATFTLAIAQAAAECPEAEALLAFISVLSPERIPRTLLETILPAGDVREQAVATLALVSLVKLDHFDDRSPAVIIHRMVQAVMRERVARQLGQAALLSNRVARVLVDELPAEPFRDTEKWPACEKIAPHALYLLDRTQSTHVELDVFLSLSYRIGRFLHGRSKLPEAAAIYWRAIVRGRAHGACAHEAVIKTLGALANLLRDRGSLKLSEPVARLVVELSREEYGAIAVETAEALNNLGVLLRDRSKYAEAESALTDAIAAGRDGQAGKKFRAAVYMNNLAVLFLMMGRHEESERLLRAAITIGEDESDPLNVDVQTWRHNLAIVLHATERYGEAEGMMPVIQRVIKAKLGATHPNYARTRVTLAKIFLETNRAAEALAEGAAGFAIYTLRPDHPWVLDAAKAVARAHRALGQTSEAAMIEADYRINEC